MVSVSFARKLLALTLQEQALTVGRIKISILSAE
jgi:hypothetical protein